VSWRDRAVAERCRVVSIAGASGGVDRPVVRAFRTRTLQAPECRVVATVSVRKRREVEAVLLERRLISEAQRRASTAATDTATPRLTVLALGALSLSLRVRVALTLFLSASATRLSLTLSLLGLLRPAPELLRELLLPLRERLLKILDLLLRRLALPGLLRS